VLARNSHTIFDGKRGFAKRFLDVLRASVGVTRGCWNHCHVPRVRRKKEIQWALE
jgi:hypothetical protein